MRAPHALRGWWRYSHLVWWQLLSSSVLALYWWLAAAGATAPHGRVALVLAIVFTAAAVLQLGYGAAHAERARRYGCW